MIGFITESALATANATTVPTGNGENGDLIAFSIPTYMTIAASTAVAWFNVIELNVQVFMTFKRHRGLYFWSLIISSYGCVLHALGFLLKFFQLTTNNYLSVTIITIGWWAMVTGQAVVLYSRLHLVVREQRVLRGVLIMIIVDAICFHIPTTVLTYGSNSNDSDAFIWRFSIIERLQMTVFSVQEFIISGIYVYSTIKLLRPVYHGRTRRVMMQLIWINLMIIAMDIVLLAFEYKQNYEIEATLKAMIYSIKLKLEFAVLNQLMTLANASVRNASNLTYEDPEAAHKELKSPPRPKSMTYLSRFYSRLSPSSSPKLPSPLRSYYAPKAKPPSRHASSNSITSQGTWSSYGNKAANEHTWIPSLDRNCVVETQHLEHASHLPSIYTNPAACYNPNPRGSPHGKIAPGSPTLSDSALIHSYDPALRGPRLPPLDLHHPPVVGVLRSSRPSVSDWAHGPDSDSNASPSGSEGRLDPFEKAGAGLHRGLSIRQANKRDAGMGLDFMTSAI
ncbi:hypothetical protein MMC13_003133 [Lambiella insularis]|nr:hypothetical protein [Lambiella insularis]